MGSFIQRIRCWSGLHRFVSCGWAERRCVGCTKHEVNLYEDGEAGWRDV